MNAGRTFVAEAKANLKYDPLPPPLELHDPKHLSAELRHDPIATNMDSLLKLQEDFVDAVLQSPGSGGLPTLIGGMKPHNTRDPIVVADMYNALTTKLAWRLLTFGRFQQYDPVSHTRTFKQTKRKDSGRIWSVKEAGVGSDIGIWDSSKTTSSPNANAPVMICIRINPIPSESSPNARTSTTSSTWSTR